MLRGYAGSVAQCRAKCEELGPTCAGFLRIRDDGKCFFRTGNVTHASFTEHGLRDWSCEILNVVCDISRGGGVERMRPFYEVPKPTSIRDPKKTNDGGREGISSDEPVRRQRLLRAEQPEADA